MEFAAAKKSKKIILTIFFILIVTLLNYQAIKPILLDGLFPMHDNTQVARIVTMGRALSDGQFPVRWVSDLGYGYGYPIYNFYAPLPYYFGGVLYAVGLNGLISTKITFIVGIVLASIFMFLFIYKIFGFWEGILASVLYTYAPYHAVQVFVRGSVGEYWALVFLPVIFLSMFCLYKTKQIKWVVLSSLGFSGLILSHTVLGYISVSVFGLLIAGWWIFNILKKKKYYTPRKLLLTLTLTMGMTAFFLLPAYFEKNLTFLADSLWDQTNFRDHFVCLDQLWSSLWGYAGSAPGCIDGMSFMLGKIHIILFLVFVVILIYRFMHKNIIDRDRMNFLISISLLTIFFIFMLLPGSQFIWEVFPLANYIQYPWRFITFIIFGLSVTGSMVLLVTKNNILKMSVAAALVIGVVFYNQKWFHPQYRYIKNPSEFETKEELRYRVSKISDEYLPKEIIKPASIDEIVINTINETVSLKVELQKERSNYSKYLLESDSKQMIQINKAYFPGWVYILNDKAVIPKVSNALPFLPLDKGKSILEMKLTNTPVRLVGNLLSITTFVLLLYIYIKYGKKSIS